MRNPVNRFRKWVERNGWWSAKDETELRSSVKKQVIGCSEYLCLTSFEVSNSLNLLKFSDINALGQVMQAIQVAEKTEKPPLSDLFLDVYDQPPRNLLEQEKLLRQTIKRHQKDYPSDVPV